MAIVGMNVFSEVANKYISEVTGTPLSPEAQLDALTALISRD